LELAMACHFRVCDEASRFSMPEVTLGINPGAGGTQRLPRLVGLPDALRMLLTGEAISARQALELGLVDEVCPGREIVERASAVLKSAAGPRKTSRRTEKVRDAEANEAAFGKAEELLSGVRPEIIAPRKIVEAVRTGLAESFQAGLKAEQQAFAECMETPATRNMIYLFFATRGMGKAADIGDVKPARVVRPAVVGMGSMGTGIAHALIIAGVPVVVCDAEEPAVDRAVARIRRSVEKRVQQGKLSAGRAEGMLVLITKAMQWRDLAEADIVIEAVYEDPAVKRSVFAAVEDACSEAAIIATNTSTISLDVLAEGMRHPERLIGMHFFNPAHRMPLVEVIRRDASSPGAVATALEFARSIRKTPVLVRNREGFLVNRIFVPYFKEAFRLLEEGAAAPDVDKAMVEFGFPMGPLALIDMAGLDILADVDKVMSRAFPAHGSLSDVAVGLVERGLLGQKAGAGVYKYEKGDYAPHHSEATDEIIAEVRRRRGLAPRPVGREEITERLVLRMVNEAFYVVQEGIVQRESDVDAAMVLGTGFPDFRGGVLKYARDVGLGKVLADMDRLAEGVGERYSPSALLREMAAVE
ncbi:MAG: 3-hydroxyacyl-CoA dehydrogenase NAD-binding domain-containing protein, partial [Phycisphaerae bacterium]